MVQDWNRSRLFDADRPTGLDNPPQKGSARRHRFCPGPRVTWEGRFRTRLADAEISPRRVQAELPVWVGIGGNPESAKMAAERGLPLALANITRPPAEFRDLIAGYRQAGAVAGYDATTLKVSLASHRPRSRGRHLHPTRTDPRCGPCPTLEGVPKRLPPG